MEEENKKGYIVNAKLTTITKCMVLGGLILIVVAYTLLNALPKNFLSTYYVTKPILDIANAIGSTLFSAGLVSVIVEASTIKTLVSNAIQNILSGNIDLDGMSQDALKDLNKNIVKKILDVKDFENTPYKYEKKLLDSVNQKYYKHNKITYHITPDEKNNCFHIKMKIDYKIINPKLLENHFEVRLKLYEMPNNNNNRNSISNNFSMSLTINKKDIKTKDILSSEPITHSGESTYYNRKIRIFKKLSGTKNDIKAELNYDVPMHDISQSFRTSSPCKSLEHKFYINKDCQTGEEWIIQANAYSTFYHKQEDDESNYSVEQNVNNSIIIKYTDWVLVGNGYCVFYQKKP